MLALFLLACERSLMRKRSLFVLWVVVAVAGFVPPAAATDPRSAAQVAHTAAAHDNQYLFVLFWKEDDDATRSVRQTLNAALAKRVGQATSVAVQVTDPAEKPVVDHYGVSRSPMPLVLAVAPNGAVTGAFALQLAEQDVARAFVTPGQARCLKAVQARKVALLCVLPAGAGPEAPAGAREFQADPRFGPSTEVLTLRADDTAEAGFLRALRIDPRTAVPVTVLLAPPGRVLGTFPGAVSKKQLVEKVTAPQSCCPGGKCGPGGCCGAPPKQ
jgi:hypothetical protein